MRNVLLIHGDGGGTWDESFINKLAKQFKRRGDTRFYIVEADIPKIEKELKVIQKYFKDGLTVFIHAHGFLDYKEDFVISDINDNLMSSKEIFTTIARNFKRPVDVFFTSCRSGGALKDRYILPMDSQIVALSQDDLVTSMDNVHGFIEKIPNMKGEPTSFNLLKQYLIDCSYWRIPPEIGICGEVGTIKLDGLTGDIFRMNINASKVKHLMSDDDLRKCLSIIKKTKHQDGIPKEYYGKILAIALTEKFGEELNHKNFSANMQKLENNDDGVIEFREAMSFWKRLRKITPEAKKEEAADLRFEYHKQRQRNKEEHPIKGYEEKWQNR